MSDRVYITDVSPRDGLQNEAGVVPTADKVRLIGALVAAGVDEIEATSFVSAKWIPQLGDAAAVLTAVRDAGWFWRTTADGAEDGGGGPPLPTGEGRGEGVEQPARKLDPRTAASRDRARGLRSRATFPERLMWGRLRNRRYYGLKFRRQSPIGPYVADYFCESLRLVIELDGRSHVGAEAIAQDARRDAYMLDRGLRVVRYSNDQVLMDIDVVLWDLKRRIEGFSGKPLTPQPPLPGGEGEEKRRCVSQRSIRRRLPGAPPAISALAPNEVGFERALAFHSAEFPLKISVFTAASETFNRKNTNASIAESVERFRVFVPRAIGMGMRVRLYVSCAIACPYEGVIAPTAVRRVCDELLEMIDPDDFDNGDVEIDLGDTIGAGTLESVRALIGMFDEIERMSLVLHLHDTFGRAAECVRAALDMGVLSFDGSVAGLGGCPYAGTKERPAPGNISTETLVRTVREAGFETGVDEDALAAAGAIAREIVGRARASAV